LSDAPHVGDIILDIYDTAIDITRWPAVLDRVAHFVGARGAFIFELQGANPDRRITAPFFSSAYDPEVVKHYLATHNEQELVDQDTFARFSRSGDSIQLVPDDVLASNDEELLARPNVQQMLQYGIRYRAGALLNKDQLNNDRFALQFSGRAGPVSKEHLAKAALIMPHLAKALSISRPTTRLAQRFQSVADCIDMLVVGICILDASGSIVLVNREFQRQLDSYRAFRKDASGRLVMTSDATRALFAELRGSTANHGRYGARPRKEAIISDLDGGAHTLCIELAPLSSADQFGEPKLQGHIIYSMDTSKLYAIDVSIMEGLFGLTQSEAAILELMAEGLTNSQISERRSKSVETVNSQVKSILDKTNSANRTQVIRLATNISSSFIAESHPQDG
jgi:DNA-binding CsgD family transcriptional regulator